MADELKTFHSILHSRLVIEAGSGDINLNVLEETGTEDERFDVRRQMKEDDAIRFLLTSPWHRHHLLVQSGLGLDTEIRTSVKEPITTKERGKLGDVDILLVPKGQPHRAMAIEAKLVRVIAKETDEGEPDEDEYSKFPKLRHGAEQTMQLLEMGFHRVVYLIFLLTDGSRRPRYNVFSRSPTTQTRRNVADYASEPTKGGAGLCMVEVIQPGMRSFRKLSQVNVGMYLEPSLHEQRQRLTEKVETVLKNVERYPPR